MSSSVCKISFKSVQVCGGCCKMFRGLTFFWDTVYLTCLNYFTAELEIEQSTTVDLGGYIRQARRDVARFCQQLTYISIPQHTHTRVHQKK